MRFTYILLVFITLSCATEQQNELELILSSGSEEFKETLDDPRHEVQIIYGKIHADSVQHFHYNVDENRFFYPASTVKMPVAIAAMQKLSEEGLSLDAHLFIDSTLHNPRNLVFDSLYNQPFTVRNLATKIFAFSGNQAHNMLYGWLGKDYVNSQHANAGLPSSRIIHQLSESAFSFTPESNANTFHVRLVDGAITKEFPTRPTAYTPLTNPTDQIRGKGYQDGSGNLVNEPFDFSQKNSFSLPDLLGCLERVTIPEYFPENHQYGIGDEMLAELKTIMELRPRELPSPQDTLPDNYVKFFLFGDSEETTYPEHISIRNKVGWAYGYLTDVAFIEDRKEGIKFFLAATIHVNENEIYNDGNYEYETVGLPFLAELGRLVHEYEVANASSK